MVDLPGGECKILKHQESICFESWPANVKMFLISVCTVFPSGGGGFLVTHKIEIVINIFLSGGGGHGWTWGGLNHRLLRFTLLFRQINKISFFYFGEISCEEGFSKMPHWLTFRGSIESRRKRTNYSFAHPRYFLFQSRRLPFLFEDSTLTKHRKNCECCPVSQLIVR